MGKKACVLYDRVCVDCGECLRCDLDPEKICDNCGACLESTDDLAEILITAIEQPDGSFLELGAGAHSHTQGECGCEEHDHVQNHSQSHAHEYGHE